MSLYTPVQTETSAIDTFSKVSSYKHVCSMQSRCANFIKKQHCMSEWQSKYLGKWDKTYIHIPSHCNFSLCFLYWMSICCLHVILNAFKMYKTKLESSLSPSEPWPSLRACDGLCWPLLRFQHPTHILVQNLHPSAPQPELSGWGRPPDVCAVVHLGPTHLVFSVKLRGWLCDQYKRWFNADK